MEMYFIILLITSLLVFVVVLFRNQFQNRMCFLKKKSDVENYGQCKNSLPKPEKDIHDMLDEYNAKGVSKNITEIDRHFTHSKGNIDGKLLDNINTLINKLLNDVNSKYNLRVKLYDVERIEEILDKEQNRQYLVSFVVHNVDKYSTSRLTLSFIRITWVM